jgi:aldose sugar dehydrogenase
MEVDMPTHSRRGVRHAATIVVSVLAATLLLVLPGVASADVGAREVAGGLNQPVAFTFGPGRVLWYVEKSSGQIRTYDLDTDQDRLFYEVSGVNGEGERGMLGIALHPQYPGEPYVYVYATRSVGGRLRNQILRITDVGGDGGARTVIFSSPASSSPYHNGGRILFGPDGMLYAIVGDGHEASNSQDLSRNDRGKILRMTPDGGIPGTNPRNSRMFAYGIRNSFGFAFDPRTDRLWETENGPACNDELNLIRKGRNYGWGPSATCKGGAPLNTNQDGPKPVRPEYLYGQTIGITGIAFCEECHLGSRNDGRAFLGAVKDGRIRRITLDARRNDVRRHRVVYDHDAGVLSIEAGPGGALYFSDFVAVYRVVRT